MTRKWGRAFTGIHQGVLRLLELVSLIGVAATAAGCATQAPVLAVPAPPLPLASPPTRTAQYQNSAALGSYWSYCDDHCPAPTPKGYKVLDRDQAGPPKQTPTRGESLSLSADVLFAFDSAAITQRGLRVLDELGDQLKSRPHLSVQVLGYTDRLGPDSYNLRLAQQRAEAVKGHLSAVVDATAVQAVGHGKASPVTGLKCAKPLPMPQLLDCLQPDRRVEIHVGQAPR